MALRASQLAFHARRLSMFCLPCYCDVARCPDDVVLVLGSGRSGTTWVADVIARLCRARIVFEPFVMLANRKSFAVSQFTPESKLNRNLQLYLPNGQCGQEPFLNQIDMIIRGRIRTWWSEMEARPGLFCARVVKDIRANLMTGHIAARWPSLRIVYVIRDPVEVIQSQLHIREAGWNFDWSHDSIVSGAVKVPPELCDLAACVTPRSPICERLVVRWCIETSVARNTLRQHPNARIVFYSRLTSQLQEWDKLLSMLGDLSRTLPSLPTLLNRRTFTSRASNQSSSGCSRARITSTIRDIAAAFHLEDLIAEVNKARDVVHRITCRSSTPDDSGLYY